jgi:hypothetical protein
MIFFFASPALSLQHAFLSINDTTSLIQTCGCAALRLHCFSAFSFGPWPKAQPTRPGARGVWRMENSVAKSHGAAGSSSMSFFALSFLDEIR